MYNSYFMDMNEIEIFEALQRIITLGPLQESIRIAIPAMAEHLRKLPEGNTRSEYYDYLRQCDDLSNQFLEMKKKLFSQINEKAAQSLRINHSIKIDHQALAIIVYQDSETYSVY